MRPGQGRAILVRVDAAVEVIDLVKTFPAPGGGTLTAVDGISFTTGMEAPLPGRFSGNPYARSGPAPMRAQRGARTLPA